ncbi:MAG: DUF3043 domain-containing protein [Candidatus Nanopelagicales bacterium]
MFGRGKSDDSQATTPATEETQAGTKGRPTPSRKEAQRARKQFMKTPSDPKAAKAAQRDAERAAKMRAREGMAAGEEKYLPARDRGPAKAFTRDFVDSRFTIAEYFIFIAVAVLLLGFIKNQTLSTFISTGFFAITALIAIDSIILVIQLNKRAKEAFPNEADRKGITLYALLRTLQLRRLRLPPPRVRRGGKPVIPKGSKK